MDLIRLLTHPVVLAAAGGYLAHRRYHDTVLSGVGAAAGVGMAYLLRSYMFPAPAAAPVPPREQATAPPPSVEGPNYDELIDVGVYEAPPASPIAALPAAATRRPAPGRNGRRWPKSAMPISGSSLSAGRGSAFMGEAELEASLSDIERAASI